jgi:hypothetical protein
MCQICKLLDQAFPSPKVLARTLFEVQGMDQKHLEELTEKVTEKLGEQSYAYMDEFGTEAKRLSDTL